MTERRYTCNLCRMTIEAGPAISREGYGVYWGGNGLELREASKTENHICKPCLTQLRTVSEPK